MNLKSTLPIFAALLCGLGSTVSAAEPLTAEKGLARLLDGNKRFVAGDSVHPHQGTAYRASLAAGQKPFVAILTCADSRVAPELIFDQGLGDIFVCRVAGNIVDNDVLGSLEYAVEHLNTPLIVVLGHEKCGAVKAAVEGAHVAGHIGQLVAAIAPAVADAKPQPGDALVNAIRANVQRSVKLLSVAEPILSEKLAAGKIKIVGARYDVATGAVELIPTTGDTKAPEPAKLTKTN